MNLKATWILTAIAEDFDFGDLVSDTCLVCYEAALGVDDLSEIDRPVNRVRSVSCALGGECKVTIAGQPVCVQCVKPSEIELLSEKHRRRRFLVIRGQRMDG